jgi:sortase A
MTRASTWARRVEILLWVLGVSLLGVAFGGVLFRWTYQAQQERAFAWRPAIPAPTGDRGIAVATGVGGAPDGPSETVDRRALVPALPIETGGASTRRREGADPAALGRIEIPRLDLVAIVKEGSDPWTLARAVGLVPGSARPGELGNMVLAGHRDTFFRPLSRIKVNDRIRMIVPPFTYEYRVQSVRVVTPDETSVLESKGVEELTLVTCYPFHYIGPAPDRFIVSAARVSPNS